MDRAAELMRELEPFQKKCTEEGRPVEISLEEAFPGDISTSFFVHVTAEWIATTETVKAITFLADILRQTADVPIRRKIFSFRVHLSPGMDRVKELSREEVLMRELEPFQKKCAEEGKPVELSLEETFPGDISTSFFVHVTAEWIRTTGSFAAINFLSEILWQTADVPVRRKVFSFKVHVSPDMDKAKELSRAEELMRELEPFQKKCAEEGRPVEITLEETFPGDISTSFFVHVTAEWIRTTGSFKAITILSEILWQTADVPIRRKIFSFKVHVSPDMDRVKELSREEVLMKELESFQKKCAEERRPVEITLQEVFTGVTSTSYFVHVTAEWIAITGTVEAINFLSKILWQTADVPVRRKIFSFKVHIIKEELQPSGFDVV